MAFSSQIVADFAVIMIVAAVVTFIFYKIKQPVVLGYLIAGIIIGPYTPPFSLVSRPDVLGAAADLGVILLLFGIGLRFPLSKLKNVGKVSAGVAGIEIAFMLVLSFGIGRLLGWPLVDALFLGVALASSSTVIIAKVLGDMGKLKETSSVIMLGVLVTEDVIVVGLLAIITSIVDTGSFDLITVSSIGAKTLAFVGGSLILGVVAVPRIVDKVGKLGNEVLLLVVLGLCFGLSIAGYLLGFSLAIGAFLMGVVMASAKSAERVESLVSPVKDMFAAMFFVSMGALINISEFQTFLLPALMVTVLMIAGKIIGCGFGVKVFGYSNATSLKVGLGMSQIGEFAFIVVKAGQDLNVVSPFLFPIVGAAAAITGFLTPYMIRLSYRMGLGKWRERNS